MKDEAVFKSGIESPEQFVTAKIGKDIYPYLKRYQFDILGDGNTNVRLINQLHISRKLIYLFLRVRDNHIPMLSEVAVALKTLLNLPNSPRNLTNTGQGLFKTYKRLIDRIIPLTVQARPIFMGDSILSNPEKHFILKDSVYVSYFVERLVPYVNASNKVTELNLDKPDEFYNLLALKSSPSRSRDYFPRVSWSRHVPVDADFIVAEIDDSSCKEIIIDASRFLKSSDFLEQETEDTSESSEVVIENTHSLSDYEGSVLRSIIKPELEVYIEKIIKIVNSKTERRILEVKDEFNKREVELIATLDKYKAELDAKHDEFLRIMVDVMSRITVRVPYQSLIPKNKFVDMDDF